MATSFKHKLINMFREFILYHSDSLTFRAKILTLLVVGNGDTINACEEIKLQDVAKAMYPDDHDRAQVLIEAVHEFYEKIAEHNNLVYDSLIKAINEDIRLTPRFTQKIDTELFEVFKECIDDEEEQIFHDRIIAFLNNLKEEYGKL